MFGIPIDGKAIMLNENKSIVGISSNKHSSITYYLIIWKVAASVVRIVWIEGISNISDALTKRLVSSRRSKLFGYWTY